VRLLRVVGLGVGDLHPGNKTEAVTRSCREKNESGAIFCRQTFPIRLSRKMEQ
jgi:hypothetical protein